jgi:hypothetical protein
MWEGTVCLTKYGCRFPSQNGPYYPSQCPASGTVYISLNSAIVVAAATFDIHFIPTLQYSTMCNANSNIGFILLFTLYNGQIRGIVLALNNVVHWWRTYGSRGKMCTKVAKRLSILYEFSVLFPVSYKPVTLVH